MSQFYEYRQNNSGGRFVIDPERGISVNVIVEAESPEAADARAETIGLYWWGADHDGPDCGCCGDRWFRASLHDVLDEPYPDDWQAYEDKCKTDWKTSFGPMKWVDGPEGYVHYLDGRIEPVLS